MAGSLARYKPYGSYRTAPTQTLTDRDFTGQRENRELGLLYYNARFYIPSIGRFASADTIVPSPANPQSYNRYSYSYNNPIKYFDPSGHCASTGLPDGSFTRSADDAACWEQYDSLVARFTKAGHSAQWILSRIGSGAGYKFKDMSIVRVQDTYVNCGRDFDCSNDKPIRQSSSPVCNYWESCWERDRQTTHTESNFLGFGRETTTGKGLYAENPQAVVCPAMCVGWTSKDHKPSNNGVVLEKHFDFGIGLGAEFEGWGASFYFMIQRSQLTDENGVQHDRIGSAFSINIPGISYQSNTTVDMSPDP